MNYVIRDYGLKKMNIFFQFEFPHIKAWIVFSLFVDERHSYGNFGPFKCQ